MRNHASTSRAVVVSHPRMAGTASLRKALASAAELAALRLAETLSRDAARNPVTLNTHIAHVNGAIGMALSLGILTEDRAMQLRKACGQMMAGTPLPTSEAAAIEPGYARIIAAVRRAAGASLTNPPEMADLGTAKAREMLDRLRSDGIVGEPDIFGHCALRAAEV